MRPRSAILAVAGPLTLVFTLAGAGAMAQAEAERRLDAAIERLRTSIGPEARITWGTRQIDPVTGRARLGDVVVTAPDRRVTVAEVTLQDVTETRLGRAELRTLLMTEGKGERVELDRLVVGGMPIPAAESRLDPATFEVGQLELEALRASGPDGRLSLGRLTASGYAPGVLGSATVEGVQFQGAGANNGSFRLGRAAVSGLVMPQPGQDPDPKAFAVTSISIEGAALADPDKNVTVDVGRLAMRDWVPGRLLDFVGEGIAIGAPFGPLGPGHVRLGRVVARGIDAAGTLAAYADGVQPPDPVPGTPQVFQMEGITAEGGGQPLFTLGRFAADGTMAADGLIGGSMVMEALRVVLPRGTAPWMEAIGYTEIAGGMEMRGTMRREGGSLSIAPWRTSWDQAGTLSVSSDLLGVPAPLPGTPADQDYTAEAMAIRIAGLSLSWREQGLLGRVIAWQARQQRQPEARIREQWAQMALTMPIPGDRPPPRRAAAPPPPAAVAPTTDTGGKMKNFARPGTPAAPAPQAAAPAAQDPLPAIRQAIASFIRQPREIEFALRPPQPLSFEAIQRLGAAGPAEAIRQLGITVRLP